MRPGMMQQQPDNGPGNFRGAAMPDRGNMHGGFRGRQGGFHIGPQGMWWRNPRVVERLTLTPDQVKRMDGIFQESRLHLIDLRANVEKQEVMLEPLLSANPLDTAKAQAQIDKVADARADLEKANAKMLLGIRAVLTPDQWTRLRDAVRALPPSPASSPADQVHPVARDSPPLQQTVRAEPADCGPAAAVPPHPRRSSSSPSSKSGCPMSDSFSSDMGCPATDH